jgi:hypothetical protein
MADEGDERAGRRIAADRASRRAAEAGVRAAELRRRLSSLQERQGDDSPPDSPVSGREAIAHAMLRRDEAAERDRAAHESAAQSHDRAASAYDRLAATVDPERREDYVSRARAHRVAATKDREAGKASPPTST